VSVALVATTFGAVAGPLSVNLLGEMADGFGLPTLTGPFLLAGVAYALAGLIILVFLRPDPYLVALAHAAPTTGGKPRAAVTPGVVVGATVMVLTQVAMVAIMTMTPIHMRHHQHGLGQVGLVISLHIAAMFLPSLVTGRLVDRLGTRPMAAASAATLLAAGLVAALAPGDSLAGLTVALVLLGLGWNFGLISGTALIVDSTPVDSRAGTQGAVDVLIALSGAGAGVASGVIVGASSYAVLSLSGGLLAVLLVPALLWLRTRPAAH
jgi:MFS family permease